MTPKKAPAPPFDKYIEVDPKNADVLFHRFQVDLARVMLKSQPDDAEALTLLGGALCAMGRHEEALEVDLRAVDVLKDDPTAHYNLSCTYSHLGRVDEGLEALRKAIELGYREFHHMLKDPDLENVRRDPRFRELLRQKWGKRQP